MALHNKTVLSQVYTQLTSSIRAENSQKLGKLVGNWLRKRDALEHQFATAVCITK